VGWGCGVCVGGAWGGLPLSFPPRVEGFGPSARHSREKSLSLHHLSLNGHGKMPASRSQETKKNPGKQIVKPSKSERKKWSRIPGPDKGEEEKMKASSQNPETQYSNGLPGAAKA